MNGKTLLALLGGLAAGAAIGAYLTSEKGSRVRANLDEVLNGLGQELNELAASGKEKLDEIANDFKAGGDVIKKEIEQATRSTNS
jgi:hypothetical protein